MTKKIFRRPYTWIIMAVVLLPVFGFTGCERIKEVYGGVTRAAPVVQVPVYAVHTMAAPQGTIMDYLALAGDVAASSTVDAYSDAAGKVTRIMVSIGTRVNRGDSIAEVDPSRPGMEFMASIVKAPVAGTIVALPAQVGMTISQAVPIARIAGGAGLEIRIYVAERFISRISLRQACEITLDAWPGEVFRGRVTEISPVVDPTSRTMEVRIVVDNAGTRLKSGMFAKVKIITEQKENVVKVPSSALLQRFGEDYVFVAIPNPAEPGSYTAQKRIITTGIIIDGVMEVERGLNPGDNVIVRGQGLLDDGSKINIVDRVTPIN